MNRKSWETKEQPEAESGSARRLTRWIWVWGPVLSWMGLIFLFSAQPSLPSAEDELLDFVIKKTGHVLEYAILSLLWSRTLETGPRSSRQKVLIALVVTGLYALTDEYHQSFVPGRTASLRDVGFDWLGAVLGVWVWRRWLRDVNNRLDRTNLT